MDFFIDSLVADVLLAVVVFVVMLVLLLKLSIISVTVIPNSWWWSSYWWDTLNWNFAVETVESIAWLLFDLSKSCWLVQPSEFWVQEALCWVSFLNSSPWLWKNGFVVGGETVNFLINALVTDISLFLL